MAINALGLYYTDEVWTLSFFGVQLALSGSQCEFYPTLGDYSSPVKTPGEPLKGKTGNPQLVLVIRQI